MIYRYNWPIKLISARLSSKNKKAYSRAKRSSSEPFRKKKRWIRDFCKDSRKQTLKKSNCRILLSNKMSWTTCTAKRLHFWVKERHNFRKRSCMKSANAKISKKNTLIQTLPSWWTIFVLGRLKAINPSALWQSIQAMLKLTLPRLTVVLAVVQRKDSGRKVDQGCNPRACSLRNV